MSYELWVTSSDIPVTNPNPRLTSSNPRVTTSNLHERVQIPELGDQKHELKQ